MKPGSQSRHLCLLESHNLVLDLLSYLLQICLNISKKIVRFEYFTAIRCDEGISGEQWCEIGANIQHFRYCVLNI